jgi:hypothetical protein
MGIKRVIDFFDDLDTDDEYKNGEAAAPSKKDKKTFIYYSDYDYLVLVFQKLNNGFHTDIVAARSKIARSHAASFP